MGAPLHLSVRLLRRESTILVGLDAVIPCHVRWRSLCAAAWDAMAGIPDRLGAGSCTLG